LAGDDWLYNDPAPGVYDVVVACQTYPLSEPGSLETVLTYKPGKFEVTGPSLRMSVEPASVAPGGTAQVSSVEPCAVGETVRLFAPWLLGEGSEGTGAETGPDGSWTIDVPVPPSATPGQYEILGTCEGGNNYASAVLTVT